MCHKLGGLCQLLSGLDRMLSVPAPSWEPLCIEAVGSSSVYVSDDKFSSDDCDDLCAGEAGGAGGGVLA